MPSWPSAPASVPLPWPTPQPTAFPRPPNSFDLTTLQREANKKFGFSASQTLAIAQALYEKQKVLTYPRTDSSALPEDYLDTARATLTRLGDGGLTSLAARAVAMVKPDKRIFNNAKDISDHFAIIPTGLVSATLSGEEAKIFDLVSRRFIAAFFPPAKYLQTVRLTVVEQETFPFLRSGPGGGRLAGCVRQGSR